MPSSFRSLGFACYAPGLLASLINRNWLQAWQEIQARLHWYPCCSRGQWEQTADGLACTLSPRGGTSLFLIWGEAQIVSRGQAGGVAWVFCPPLRCCCVQGACSVPCFCFQHRFYFFFFWLQTLQKCQLGFLVPLSLLGSEFAPTAS